RGYAVLMAMLGPAVLLLAAVAKAAAGWRSSIPLPEFGRMVAASAVMLAARTVGTVWQLRTWRSYDDKMKCVCGTDMRLLQHNIHLCSSCGRARWGDTNIPFGVIILIAVVT